MNIEDLISLVTQHTGLKTREQDKDTFKEKIWLRLKELKLNLLADYYQLLAAFNSKSEEEWEKLFLLLTNTESYFFRDQGQFNLLRNPIIPEIIERQQNSKSIRICSAGCSTGEEPYSLAILLKELIGDLAQWNLQIWGIDINQEALLKARKGIYSAWSFRSVDEEIQRRYFREIKNQYHLESSIKQMVKFHQVNLVKDLLPQPQLDLKDFDLIICRNVFIYFDTQAVSNVLDKFYHSLQPLGYLLTGHAELYGQNLSRFEAKLFPDSIIYQRQRETQSHNFSPTFSQKENLNQSLVTINNELKIENYAQKGLETKKTQPAKKTDPIKTNYQLPENDEHLMEEAAKLVQEKAYDLAINKLNQVLKKQPRNFHAYYLMAQIYANRGKYQKASEYCQKALAINSFAVKPHYLLAQMAEETGDLEAAKQAFKKIIYLEHNSLAAYLALSNIYQQEGEEKRSKKMLFTALNILRQLPPSTKIPEQGNLTAAELISKLENV
ncbi:MAG: tetratricopeptide repeat protein [Gomphosphaeria aponina SAG 52.96 = DSM 107014]|uniref:protein-glutamate O-methyltransferase n=1 Tax=Gomphosphaeria aponina SAG 52.96 = DSM 107014 TaxID=1521640 RepID=A0A941GNU4_9CHRO|nr:tetratricopeptide repeat protein [Gomphosphaeria aponina SAG 52.96 = DSM 107014]